MKKLPSVSNVNIFDVLNNITNQYAKHYRMDFAHDVKFLYKSVLMDNDKFYWGVRECGTEISFGMSYSMTYFPELDISLFMLTNVHMNDEMDLIGDIKMVTNVDKFQNEEVESNMYRGQSKEDVFIEKVMLIKRDKDKNPGDWE